MQSHARMSYAEPMVRKTECQPNLRRMQSHARMSYAEPMVRKTECQPKPSIEKDMLTKQIQYTMITDIIRRIAVAFAVLLPVMSLWGQNTGFITLYGHVCDSRTSESLFYASVNLSGTNVNNVSNLDGFFSLKIPESTSPDTNVAISHLGYHTGTVKVSAFVGHTSSNPLQIPLVEASILLDPVTVRSADADELVRLAFYKVRDNYPTTRVGMTAFYREMIRKGTAKYPVLNEAVIDIDKAPYVGYSPDRVGIYKGRGCTNYDSSDTLFIKFQGGILTALEIDQAKNPFAGVNLDELLTTYHFDMEGEEAYDGRTFYRVSFRPNDNVEEILFKGSIYIDVESLAIGRVEMEMDLEGREEEAARIFVIKRPRNVRFFTNHARYVVNYKCFDGKWYYDYCRVDLSFTTRKRNSLFRKTFTITEEMAVTDHKVGNIAIEQVNRVRFKDVLSDKVADFTDENFWADYNIIEPDQSIEVIINRMVRKLSNRR
jgi:hypothetical protein